jgi:hypothetical protein
LSYPDWIKKQPHEKSGFMRTLTPYSITAKDLSNRRGPLEPHR